jgi:hypothetical protein
VFAGVDSVPDLVGATSSAVECNPDAKVRTLLPFLTPYPHVDGPQIAVDLERELVS